MVFAWRDLPEAWMPRGEHYRDVLAAVSRHANTVAVTPNEPLLNEPLLAKRS
jgi:hypothetical protein